MCVLPGLADHADPCHAANVWGAIRRAKGFEPDFATWWCTAEFAAHGAPSERPTTPPEAAAAEAIYASFVIAFRALEKQLYTNCRATVKAKRLASPQLIFQDIRGVGVDSVDLLMQPAQGKIFHVEEDTQCLHLDKSCNWDTTKPVFVNGQSLNILHHEDAWLWVDRIVPNLVGSVCTQVRLIGALEELFDEFRQSWSARWQRHAHVPQSQWHDILEFARKYARPVACHSPPIEVQDLKLELKRKKAKTSRGLDGVTLKDLRQCLMGF